MAGGDTQPEQHDAAKTDYERKVNKTGKTLEELENASDDGTSNNATVKEREAAAVVSKGQDTKEEVTVPLGKRLALQIRNKSAFMFVIGIIIMGIGYASLFAPNIILVNIKDLFVNDLADATTALSKYSIKMIDYKLGKSDCSDKETIKCKLTTMSRAQVLAFKKFGFTVNGEKVEEDNLDDRDFGNDKPESRWKVSSIEFPDNVGTASSGDQFKKLADTNDKIRNLTNAVWNPRSSFFMDARFQQRLKTEFDLTKNATTSGTTYKEVNESFDASMQGSSEKVNEAGQGAYSLKTLTENDSKDALNKTSQEIAKQVNSYTQGQCAMWTQQKVVYNAVQEAKTVTVARFAMQYLIAADQIKAGGSSEITTNTLASKVAWSPDGGYNGSNATDASMYRHIVLREGVTASGTGQKYYAWAFDTPGVLLPATVQLLTTSTATKGITGAPGGLGAPPTDIASDSREYCLSGQTNANRSAMKPSNCPALTFAGAPGPTVGAVGGIAILSDRICPPPPKGQYLMTPTALMTVQVTMPYISGVLNGLMSGLADRLAKDFTYDTKGEAASDAIFAGTGIILGDMAMSRGMRPADKSSLTTYLAQETTSDKEAELVDRYAAKQNQFDIYNEFSFAGSLARSLGATSASSSTTPILASLANVMGLIPTSIGKLSTNANAIYNLQPDKFEPSRLTCSDSEYLEIGIEADMGCNIRYSMSKEEMDADVDDVLAYMTEKHPEETDKNIQELQQRQQQTDGEGTNGRFADKAMVSRMLSEAQKANGEPFIDKKTGKAIENSEYDKYLRYCVNREDPWGRTGLDVRSKELDDDEKEKRRLSKSPDGVQIGTEGQGSEYERVQTDMYMAVTEGASGDQDWYTGKKCLEDSEMLTNFRAYTMACSVDGSFAGTIDCTQKDYANYWSYVDDFYTSNDIHFLSWH